MLYSTTFLTLDGVMADPHVWHPAYASREALDLLESQVAAAGTMLIGRRTYEEFASWWPGQGDEVPLARVTNAIRKDVVTSTLDHDKGGGVCRMPGVKHAYHSLPRRRIGGRRHVV
jgi:dihydrofolate reductase